MGICKTICADPVCSQVGCLDQPAFTFRDKLRDRASPCAKQCEAQAFKIEIRQLKANIERWKQVAKDAAVAKTKVEACEIVEQALDV